MIPMDYLVVIERGTRGYGAYVPDLPGVGVAGRTLPEVRRLIRRAVELHMIGLREDRLPVPRPRSRSEWIDIPDSARAGAGRDRARRRAAMAAAS
jgi:predicted RNase H-like HicB family nuclease